jgi:hypothetical protein
LIYLDSSALTHLLAENRFPDAAATFDWQIANPYATWGSGSGFVARRWKLPEMTVTISAVGWLWAAILYPAGNFKRTT